MINNFNIDELKNKIKPYKDNPDSINSRYPSSYITYIFDKIIELFLWSKEYIETMRSEINRYVDDKNKTISTNLGIEINKLKEKQIELKEYIDSEIENLKNSSGESNG